MKHLVSILALSIISLVQLKAQVYELYSEETFKNYVSVWPTENFDFRQPYRSDGLFLNNLFYPEEITYSTRNSPNAKWENKWIEKITYDSLDWPILFRHFLIGQTQKEILTFTDSISNSKDSTEFFVIRWLKGSKKINKYQHLVIDSQKRVTSYITILNGDFDTVKLRNGECEAYHLRYDKYGQVDSMSYEKWTHNHNYIQEFTYDNKYDSKGRLMEYSKYLMKSRNQIDRIYDYKRVTRLPNGQIDSLIWTAHYLPGYGGKIEIRDPSSNFQHWKSVVYEKGASDTSYIEVINSKTRKFSGVRKLEGKQAGPGLYFYQSHDFNYNTKAHCISYYNDLKQANEATPSRYTVNYDFEYDASSGAPISYIKSTINRLGNKSSFSEKWTFRGNAKPQKAGGNNPNIPVNVSLSIYDKATSVYPNPVRRSKLLTIKSETNLLFMNYVITDIAGNRVMNGIFETKTIDVSELNAGYFILQVGNEEPVRFVVL